MINRRSFLTGLIAAPAVVQFASLMPIRGIVMDIAPRLGVIVYVNQNSVLVCEPAPADSLDLQTIGRYTVNNNLFSYYVGDIVSIENGEVRIAKIEHPHPMFGPEVIA